MFFFKKKTGYFTIIFKFAKNFSKNCFDGLAGLIIFLIPIQIGCYNKIWFNWCSFYYILQKCGRFQIFSTTLHCCVILSASIFLNHGEISSPSCIFYCLLSFAKILYWINFEKNSNRKDQFLYVQTLDYIVLPWQSVKEQSAVY